MKLNGRALLLLVVLAFCAFTQETKALVLSGTVVHRSRVNHSFTISNNGKLTEIHAAVLPRLGKVVKVNAKKLNNKTYAAVSTKVVGTRVHTKLLATVTYANNSTASYVVSDRGTSLAVNATSEPLPVVGDQVLVKASIDTSNGDLTEVSKEDLGTETGDSGSSSSSGGIVNTSIVGAEGVIQSIDTVLRQIVVLLDDDGSDNSAAMTVNVPLTFDITAFAIGEVVEFEVTQNADGVTFDLAQLSDDSSIAHADNPAEDQGDHDNHTTAVSDSQGSSSSTSSEGNFMMKRT